MAMPNSQADRDFLKFREDGSGNTAVNVVLSPLDATSTANIESKKTTSLAAGNNDDSITFALGTTATVRKIQVAAPGAVGDLQIRFYDAAAPTTPITGALYLASQPAGGFDLTGIKLSGKVLGWRITGWTSGSTSAYLNINYSYQ